MKVRFILVLLAGIILTSACGKVSNETGAKKENEDVIYYTTLVGSVPVSEKFDGEYFSLKPTENALVVSFSLVNKDGTERILAWGRGAKEEITVSNNEGTTVNIVSNSYSIENKTVKKESPQDILIKWVKDKGEKWEFYIKYESFSDGVYFVNLMNNDGSLYMTVPITGRSVSENVTEEVMPASYKTTLWSRIFLADESKNIIKRSTLSIDNIASRYDNGIYKALNYKPSDLRVKTFSVQRPYLSFPGEESMEYILSEVIHKIKDGPRDFNLYISKIPTEVIPTAGISLIRSFLNAPRPAQGQPRNRYNQRLNSGNKRPGAPVPGQGQPPNYPSPPIPAINGAE